MLYPHIIFNLAPSYLDVYIGVTDGVRTRDSGFTGQKCYRYTTVTINALEKARNRTYSAQEMNARLRAHRQGIEPCLRTG